MKFIKYIFLLFIAGACTYDFPDPVLPSAGGADFTKFVSVGNSLTAGYMDGALYTRGQNSSFPSILATQFQQVGGGTFVQPDIGSENGFYAINPLDNSALGRLILITSSTTGSTAPGPTLNGDMIGAYTGAAVNNFGVPGMKVIEAGVAGYGTLNPYFGRFASNAATASVLSDAAASGATFFTMWLGNNDVLGYATNGASGTDGGINPGDMTDVATFTAAYSGALNAMLAGGAKGLVANIPSVTSIPYFELVPYNSIVFDATDPVDAATIAALNDITAFGGYNAALDAIVAGAIPGVTLSADDAAKRKVVYADGPNPILIKDEALPDLTGALSAINPALAAYGQIRPMTSSELVTLPAASVLGTTGPAPTLVNGVSWPMDDQYILTSTEIDLITQRTNDFNDAIAAAVTANSANVGLIDMSTIFNSFKQTGAVINGSPLDASIFPPFGAFSVDGVHLNGRGYGYVANLMIEAINEKFGSTVPLANPNDFPGNDFPIVQ